jgi:hypothetical protein
MVRAVLGLPANVSRPSYPSDAMRGTFPTEMTPSTDLPAPHNPPLPYHPLHPTFANGLKGLSACGGGSPTSSRRTRTDVLARDPRGAGPRDDLSESAATRGGPGRVASADAAAVATALPIARRRSPRVRPARPGTVPGRLRARLRNTAPAAAPGRALRHLQDPGDALRQGRRLRPTSDAVAARSGVGEAPIASSPPLSRIPVHQRGETRRLLLSV